MSLLFVVELIGELNLSTNLCFYSKDVSSLLSAFTTYVRPILEYCCVVWNSLLVKDINALEAVQRRFTKRIPGRAFFNQNLSLHKRAPKAQGSTWGGVKFVGFYRATSRL